MVPIVIGPSDFWTFVSVTECTFVFQIECSSSTFHDETEIGKSNSNPHFATPQLAFGTHSNNNVRLMRWSCGGTKGIPFPVCP